MSLKIKNPKTKYEFEIEESILFYQKIPFLNKKRMLFRNMTNGELRSEDGIELAYEVMAEMVVGWKNVHDEEDVEIPYNKELVKSLPVGAVMQFFDDVVLPEFEEFSTSAEALAKRGKLEKGKTPSEEDATSDDELGNSEAM